MACCARGLTVTLLIRSGYPLSLQVDETAGRMIQAALVAHGLDVRVDIEVTAFEGNGRVQRARLSDGSVAECDIVVIGKGVLPALDFVPREAVDIDLGIRVDAHMQTSATDIYAAGDVAQSIDIARQTGWVNAIWPEAVTQGRLAGLNMAGRPVAYEGSLSRNVIRIFDMDVMTAGLLTLPEDDGYHAASARQPKDRHLPQTGLQRRRPGGHDPDQRHRARRAVGVPDPKPDPHRPGTRCHARSQVQFPQTDDQPPVRTDETVKSLRSPQRLRERKEKIPKIFVFLYDLATLR